MLTMSTYEDLYKNLREMKTDEFNLIYKQGDDMLPGMEKDGTGQLLEGVHRKSTDCTKYGCSIHAPSDHKLKTFPTRWRDDIKAMERLCPHKIGHPDPDHLAWVKRNRSDTAYQSALLHVCDGCCV